MITSAPVIVNTTEVKNRRAVRFEAIDQAITESRRLADLERQGQAIYLGNWTVGQILNHVGAWAEYAYVSNPLKAPWFVKILLRPMKGKFLNQGFPAGRNIPKVPGGSLAIERVPADQGLTRFEKAFTRLKNEAPTQLSPVFGMLTHEEAIKLNLRHAELHMSFVMN